MKRLRVFSCLLLLLLVMSGCGFLTKSGTISGVVKDAANSLVLEGATITLKGSNTSAATTTSAGTFQLENVKYGKAEIIVAASGYQTKTIPVTVNAPTVSLTVELERIPLELADAKQFVRDFRTSLYEIGSIAIAETGVVNQFTDNVQDFFTDVTPYIQELAYALDYLDIIQKSPGVYTFEGWDPSTGEPDYELVTAGDKTDPQWVWEVSNPSTGMTVELYSPNIDNCFTTVDEEQIIDFTDTEFGYNVTSNTFPDAEFTGEVNVGSENVTLFQVPIGSDLVTVKVPSGKTVTAAFVIDSHVAAIGAIGIDASFDLTKADTDMEAELDGTVTTPVFTYTGNLALSIGNVDTIRDPSEPKSFHVSGSGNLQNPLFQCAGEFSAALSVYIYGDFEDFMVLPENVSLEGTYTSTDTRFTGSIEEELSNMDSFSFTEPWVPHLEAALHGEVQNLTNIYMLNLEAAYTDGKNIALSTELSATDKYDLTGTFNIHLDNGLTEAFMENENGLFIQFDVTASDPSNIGSIYREQNGTQFATIAVVLEDRDNPCVSVNFTDNTSEIVPLNPLIYLTPEG